MQNMRRKLFWFLLSIADRVVAIALARDSKLWRKFLVSLANGIDRTAWLTSTESMRREPVNSEPHNACGEPGLTAAGKD